MQTVNAPISARENTSSLFRSLYLFTPSRGAVRNNNNGKCTSEVRVFRGATDPELWNTVVRFFHSQVNRVSVCE